MERGYHFIGLHSMMYVLLELKANQDAKPSQ
jgi:hypothetical protein